MNRSCVHLLGRIVCGGLILAISAHVSALEPPRAGEVQKYKADGTWSSRVKRAYMLGNHRVDPALVANAHHRIMAEAVGGPLAAPPPNWQGGLPASGTPKTVCLLVDFAEYPHAASQTVADVQLKMFGAGSGGSPYESIRNFYRRASYNSLTVSGNVLGWYRAQNPRTYYEGLGDGPGQEALMMEAFNYFNAQGHDFAQYDNNNDGQIDAFFIKWTGPDNGWANFWWAYQWGWWANPGYTVDGKRPGRYVWSWYSNPDGGTYWPQVDIHESGHLLGLPDLYDYDGSVGPNGGVGGLDMMDGNWGDHNCFSKFMLGWLTPSYQLSGTTTRTLYPSGTNRSCVLIMPSSMYTQGTLFDEFFMVQYRKRSAGNDPSDYPTDGFVIWHVDSTLTADGNDFLYNNSYTDHKMVRLMEADGLEEIEAGLDWADAGDFYRSPKTISDTTTPNSKAYGNIRTGVRVDQLTTPSTTMRGRFAIVP